MGGVIEAIEAPLVVKDVGTWVGCFQDVVSDNNWEHIFGSLSSEDVLKECSELCREKGYHYTAMEDGSYCQCSNSLPSTKILDTLCDRTPCPFDHGCGGSHRASLFANEAHPPSLG